MDKKLVKTLEGFMKSGQKDNPGGRNKLGHLCKHGAHFYITDGRLVIYSTDKTLPDLLPQFRIETEGVPDISTIVSGDKYSSNEPTTPISDIPIKPSAHVTLDYEIGEGATKINFEDSSSIGGVLPSVDHVLLNAKYVNLLCSLGATEFVKPKKGKENPVFGNCVDGLKFMLLPIVIQ